MVRAKKVVGFLCIRSIVKVLRVKMCEKKARFFIMLKVKVYLMRRKRKYGMKSLDDRFSRYTKDVINLH